MAKSKRILIQFECPVCKSRNYTTEKNPENPGKKGKEKAKLVLRKYCKHCRKVTEHKEVKI